jgi:hypothetical protein
MWQIVHLLIEIFYIQSYVNFKVVKIDDVAYKKLFHLLVYKNIREFFFKKKMLILYLLNINLN